MKLEGVAAVAKNAKSGTGKWAKVKAAKAVLGIMPKQKWSPDTKLDRLLQRLCDSSPTTFKDVAEAVRLHFPSPASAMYHAPRLLSRSHSALHSHYHPVTLPSFCICALLHRCATTLGVQRKRA